MRKRGVVGAGHSGQATLEYILVVAAVVVAIGVAIGAFLKPSSNKAVQQSANMINNAADQIAEALNPP